MKRKAVTWKTVEQHARKTDRLLRKPARTPAAKRAVRKAIGSPKRGRI
jgi:hypothetical protein